MVNNKNPLTKYKFNSGKEWREIAPSVGVTVTTLIRVATKNKESVRTTSYDTIIKIKDSLGVDIINDWE